MHKRPYLPLYTGDWKKDPQLSRCAPATRGIWIDLLCDMHELDRCGELRGTAEELAVAARCPAEQLIQALTDLQAKGAADIEQRNGLYVVRNRRMYAESRKRKSAAERQMRYRNKDCNTESNANVSLSDIEADFELFWEEYPRGRRKDKGRAREAFFKAVHKAEARVIIDAAKEYAQSDVGRGKFVQMPATWLNGECWNDDPEAWRDRDKPAAEREYIDVSAVAFMGHVKDKAFKDGPHRNALNPCWVYGTLRDGRKIECKMYPPPKEAQ